MVANKRVHASGKAATSDSTRDGDHLSSSKTQPAKEASVSSDKTKKRKGGSYLNISTLTTAAMILYIGFAARNFAAMLDPLGQIPEEVWRHSRLVQPLWPEHSKVSVEVAISTLATLSSDLMRNESAYAETTVIAWRESGIVLNSTTSNGKTMSFELHAASSPPSTLRTESRTSSWLIGLFVGSGDDSLRTPVAVPDSAWRVLEANGTLFRQRSLFYPTFAHRLVFRYLHAAVYLDDTTSKWRGLADGDERRTTRLPPLSLVKYEPPPTGRAALPKRKLLGDLGLGHLGPPAPWSPSPPPPGAFVAKWKPEAAIRIVAEFRAWPDACVMAGLCCDDVGILAGCACPECNAFANDSQVVAASSITLLLCTPTRLASPRISTCP